MLRLPPADLVSAAQRGGTAQRERVEEVDAEQGLEAPVFKPQVEVGASLERGERSRDRASERKPHA